MAEAIDVVADVLALVRERDEARESRDVSQRQADAVLAGMREIARQVEMLRAERDKAIEDRDLRREREEAAIARAERAESELAEAKTSVQRAQEWAEFERNGLRETRDMVRTLVGGDENKPVVDAVRALVEQRDLYASAATELEAVRAALGLWQSGQSPAEAVRDVVAARDKLYRRCHAIDP